MANITRIEAVIEVYAYRKTYLDSILTSVSYDPSDGEWLGVIINNDVANFGYIWDDPDPRPTNVDENTLVPGVVCVPTEITPTPPTTEINVDGLITESMVRQTLREVYGQDGFTPTYYAHSGYSPQMYHVCTVGEEQFVVPYFSETPRNIRVPLHIRVAFIVYHLYGGSEYSEIIRRTGKNPVSHLPVKKIDLITTINSCAPYFFKENEMPYKGHNPRLFKIDGTEIPRLTGNDLFQANMKTPQFVVDSFPYYLLIEEYHVANVVSSSIDDMWYDTIMGLQVHNTRALCRPEGQLDYIYSYRIAESSVPSWLASKLDYAYFNTTKLQNRKLDGTQVVDDIGFNPYVSHRRYALFQINCAMDRMSIEGLVGRHILFGQNYSNSSHYAFPWENPPNTYNNVNGGSILVKDTIPMAINVMVMQTVYPVMVNSISVSTRLDGTDVGYDMVGVKQTVFFEDLRYFNSNGDERYEPSSLGMWEQSIGTVAAGTIKNTTSTTTINDILQWFGHNPYNQQVTKLQVKTSIYFDYRVLSGWVFTWVVDCVVVMGDWS